MSISFDSALGIHEQATLLRARRAEILADNIANADTPGYKARDIDFARMLQGEKPVANGLALDTTEAGHQQPILDPSMAADLMYRVPMQPSVDDNTVEVQQEMARYTDNALHYQASLDFLSQKFKGISKALTGE